MSAMSSLQFLSRLAAPRLAYHRLLGKNPGLVFLPGFMSNMQGEKALALEKFCQSSGHAFVRFDYTGCGKSEGNSNDCVLGDWKGDALAVFDELTTGPQVLVGSSMGGWLMLLVAQARPERVAGLLGIATAADSFVNTFKQLPLEVKEEVEKTGLFKFSSKYSSSGHYMINYSLIKEAEQHCVLGNSIPILCPVRLLHGLKDESIPWQVSLQVLESLASQDVDVILRKNGDHRLSTTADLALLVTTVGDLLEKVAPLE
ncbi:palmitoyl-protein thioesterase ABHD10, mitochondrial [Latimeria chalumnae]|nr:PREDICTED: mycophenolic acid acyl-glucuronide esterase, mitochondrial-like [Latimeria chalumnae]|eukprot:XP_005987314.1 PREDICTED: mycophenolic acid acyl-glucuronide esterase, mitochondrial-like [Latimeria chalumnae]